MLDSTGLDFCEVCGLDFDNGVCPNCNPVRKVSKAGQAARAYNDRTEKRRAVLASSGRAKRMVLSVFWWLTA